MYVTRIWQISSYVDSKISRSIKKNFQRQGSLNCHFPQTHSQTGRIIGSLKCHSNNENRQVKPKRLPTMTAFSLLYCYSKQF